MVQKKEEGEAAEGGVAKREGEGLEASVLNNEKRAPKNGLVLEQL